MRDEGGFLAVGRECQGWKTIAQRQMFHGCSGRRAPAIDGYLCRLTTFGVQLPDAEVALKGDDAAVVGNSGPQDAAIAEMRHLPGPAAGERPSPDILRAAAIRYVVQAAAIGRPHRPRFLRSARFRQSFVTRRNSVADQPDFRFIEMAVALAPPLRIDDAAGGDGESLAVRRRGGKIFAGVAVGRDPQ